METVLSFFLNLRQSVRILVAGLYIAGVAALSLLPMRDLPHIHEFRGFDKIVHFCMYFGMSGLLAWATNSEAKNVRLFYLITATIGWGFLMEIMQLEMHLGRQFSWFDMLANATGVFSGTAVYFLLVKRAGRSISAN